MFQQKFVKEWVEAQWIQTCYRDRLPPV